MRPPRSSFEQSVRAPCIRHVWQASRSRETVEAVCQGNRSKAFHPGNWPAADRTTASDPGVATPRRSLVSRSERRRGARPEQDGTSLYTDRPGPAARHRRVGPIAEVVGRFHSTPMRSGTDLRQALIVIGPLPALSSAPGPASGRCGRGRAELALAQDPVRGSPGITMPEARAALLLFGPTGRLARPPRQRRLNAAYIPYGRPQGPGGPWRPGSVHSRRADRRWRCEQSPVALNAGSSGWGGPGRGNRRGTGGGGGSVGGNPGRTSGGGRTTSRVDGRMSGVDRTASRLDGRMNGGGPTASR
jgi:hypothetical protein